VIVGVPGLGFRDGMRADNAVTNAGRTFVPVLTEQDYYRAETEQIEVFAPLVPMDRVWVELVADDRQRPIHPPAALDSPQPRPPIPVLDATCLLGRRVVQAVPDGFIRDLRTVTDVYRDANGRTSVRICGELEWYRWALVGTAPSTVETSADSLWVE
jgi:hypothetical protein